ncbi:SagB/ThcOx family dehydrogenase [Alloscardovia macacae]|uniref:TOMM biosynthesis dehydrogenase (Protein B) n=1 Tax=Alloscardovia macacae TaxID=1160091 RepID=A0A261F3L9_9BIFI|nr:SagB/ThcOx family dehydrogenase [Alloscardovia macacae]OZG53727.1 TOMM biosynthesis dehydrogenase (protein B) [Alloscardovia macacae]
MSNMELSESIRNEIISQISNCQPEELTSVKEFIESMREVSESRIGEVTLCRIIQRLFARSVNEFFSAEHVSMQMTRERILRYRASTSPDRINLPIIDMSLDVAFDDVVASRRSIRDYLARPLSIESFSTLLKRSFGKNGCEDGYGIRDIPLYPYPSMGGLSSFDIGIVVQNVESIPCGYYRYDQVGHALEPIISGDMRLALQDVTFESEWLMYAPIIVVVVNNAHAFTWKYHTRGYRMAHIDVGAAIQSLYLSACSMELGCCAVAGFLDDSINGLLGYDGLDQYVSIIAGVGEPAIPLLARGAQR